MRTQGSISIVRKTGLMSSQPQLIKMALDPNDIFYTPDWVAQDMVSYFKPSGSILEPCAGDGVFLRYLSGDVSWCEIEKERDFFAWNTPVNWLVGNPPYNILKKWLSHSFDVANNILYVLPITKIFNSYYQLQEVYKYGGVVAIRVYGAGRVIKWPMGFAIGAVHLQKDYQGNIDMSFYSALLSNKRLQPVKLTLGG